MNPTSSLDRFVSFLNSQIHTPGTLPGDETGLVRSITISRQSGCGASYFAEQLAARLQSRQPRGSRPWTVFDRGLVEAVLRDQHLPARLASFMPEDRVSQVSDIIEYVFSLHPPAETLVWQTSETILRLAQLGRAIIIGRGATVITSPLPGMLHLRLIGSIEQRIARVRQRDSLDRQKALQQIKREDGGRERYLKKYFHTDLSDPLLYHFVINTDRVALDEAADMVCAFISSTKTPLSPKDMFDAGQKRGLSLASRRGA